MTEETKAASLVQIKAFMEEKDTKKFADEWKGLSPEDKEWFKKAVGEVI